MLVERFKKHFDQEWYELNEFNICRRLKLEGFKINLTELIYLLKLDYVDRYIPLLAYFDSVSAWDTGSEDHINYLCRHVKVRNLSGLQVTLKNGWSEPSNAPLNQPTIIFTTTH